MPKIESYRKQAKLLLRWHRERNYSVGEHVRMLKRYRHLSDADVLAMPMPLTLAQEIVAVSAGHEDWTALKAAADGIANSSTAARRLEFKGVIPILFVRSVTDAAEFYTSKLGFHTDFLHGKPPFYGSVSRDGICFHLRLVGQPNFAELADRETSLILATVEVTDVKSLFAEYESRGVELAQPLIRQAWGGLDFQIRDPDGNRISFVEYRSAGAPAAAS